MTAAVLISAGAVVLGLCQEAGALEIPVGPAIHSMVAAVAAAPDAALTGQALRDACAQEFGGADFDTVVAVAAVVEGVALLGAAVGGFIARQRKDEVEKINAQLRQININLRKQARVESYAPALSYAPVGAPRAAAAAASVAAAPSAPSREAPAAGDAADGSTGKRDPRKGEVLRTLRAGKQLLRSSNNAGACEEFKKALALAQELGDAVEEKKAARGVGAALQRQRKYEEAIKFHSLVLQRSKRSGERSGDTEAFGAIADCYTEMGDLENAAKYYDKYIAHLEDDDE